MDILEGTLCKAGSQLWRGHSGRPLISEWFIVKNGKFWKVSYFRLVHSYGWKVLEVSHFRLVWLWVELTEMHHITVQGGMLELGSLEA